MSDEREEAMEEMTTEVENLKLAWRFWVAERELEQLHQMVNGLWLLYDGKGWYQATIELTTQLLEVLSTTTISTPEQAQQEIMLQTSLASPPLAPLAEALLPFTWGAVFRKVEPIWQQLLGR